MENNTFPFCSVLFKLIVEQTDPTLHELANLQYVSKQFENYTNILIVQYVVTHMGVQNKAVALDQIVTSLGLTTNDCAVMGDDWPDLQMMKNAGLRICPSQAHGAVKEFAHLVTTRSGGNGAVREVCDFILNAQNKYEALLHKACS